MTAKKAERPQRKHGRAKDALKAVLGRLLDGLSFPKDAVPWVGLALSPAGHEKVSPMSTLLHTATHEKLPKGFSHPTSTEKLSHALEGVEMFSEIQLHFHAHEGKVLGKNHRLHGAIAKKLEGYRLFLECSWSQEGGWGISIYAVPSLRKAKLSADCAELALPGLREWLGMKRPESWFIGERFFQLAVSEFTDELAFQEIHNDRVEHQREILEAAR